MIYVVEIPEQARPRAWFAFDQQDFVRKVRASKASGDWTIYALATAHGLLGSAGLTADAPGASDAQPEIFALAERHGWEAELYRADYLLGPGEYQTEPVTEFEACVAAVAHDLRACRIYLSDESASSALYRDPLYDVRDGFDAHMALREQLIAMEVIADDM